MSRARPCHSSVRDAPNSKPLPRISAKIGYLALIAVSPSRNHCSRSFTPARTSGLLTSSITASATAHANGLPPYVEP